MKKAHKGLWITLTCVFGVLAAAMWIGTSVANTFEIQVNNFLNCKTYKVVDSGDSTSDTSYYKSAFKSEDELVAHEKELCENLEGEGATLLKNEGKVLPLATTAKFSCFSHSSVDPIYGGTGSGQVKTTDAISLKSALEANFGASSVNSALWDFYTNDCADYKRVNAKTTGGASADYKINEVPWSKITANTTVTNSFSSFGDVALVVLARSGGEGSDLPFNECSDGTNGDYLELCQNEIDMMKALKVYKDAGTFKKIIVLINSSNALQLDFLDKADYGIDAALWIGDVGMTGINAVSDILAGKVNPSGRLSDTFLKNNMSSPAMANFGLQAYTNHDDYGTGWVQYNQPGAAGKANQNYIVYQEGVYVGYRYYETRYEDYAVGTANVGSYSYSDEVAFPFGYGDSYTSFSYSDYSLTQKGDSFTAKVTVKNVGSVVGKHSVEIYAQSPYTDYDRENLIEKPAVNLVGFAKTASLEPNASETVSIDFTKYDLASYDANKAKTYVLDAGDYYFTVGKNAHNAVNNILAAKGKTVANTSKMDEDGDSALVKSWKNASLDTSSCSKSRETGYAITNRFDNADLNKYEGTTDQKITYVSRNNWTGTMPSTNVKLKINDAMWADGLIDTEEGHQAIITKMKAENYAEVTKVPDMGKDNGMQAITYRGVDFDSDSWALLIQEVSYADMTNVIYNGMHLTKEITSIGLPATKDENGPQGYTKNLMGGSSAMAYTSEDVMAATRNKDLVADMGSCIGEDCLNVGNTGLYGPGANIHRTPYCGRNFEYYSEDGFLSGAICQAEVAQIESKGVVVYTKHLALNDQENGRMGLSTWANEQSIREIYLRGFEGSANGTKFGGYMSSFNRLGVVWSGAHYGLMTEVIRNEWGLKGACITDCSVFATYMDYRYGLLAGQDYWDGMGMNAYGVNTLQLDGLDTDPVIVTCAQKALKRIIYSNVNSLAMNGISSTSKIVPVTPWWKTMLGWVDGVLTAVTIGCAGMLVYTIVKSKKAAPAPEEK
jgi:beta-glucosidase